MVHEKILKARYKSAQHFEETYRSSLIDFDFAAGALVLVRNSRTAMELNRKSKPRYLGPMVVVRRTQGGSYILAELTGAISKTRYAAFRLLPYHPRTHASIPVTSITGLSEEELDMMTHGAEDAEGTDDPSEGDAELSDA
ncbi:hypothetical protein BD410DRAFT_734231 [Rickenella mellea]|uniref:Uncharacterized protein n=1 Tax=Rickenella mellea TaxID=50990 RepID=A0A4Y7PGS1_9AGAM|nr:hypothetical protein BD410DRAFT_734231 [Rickenella mellea]